MGLFLIPDRVSVVIALDPDLLALLKQVLDQQSDRAAAVALTATVKARTAALAAAIKPVGKD